jgi:hypothetical protein
MKHRRRSTAMAGGREARRSALRHEYDAEEDDVDDADEDDESQMKTKKVGGGGAGGFASLSLSPHVCMPLSLWFKQRGHYHHEMKGHRAQVQIGNGRASHQP